MSTADETAPVSDTELEALFAGLESASGLVLAVSGGPDSTALLLLAARWRAARQAGPKLLAVTIDHGLRPEAAAEAHVASQLATRFGVRHRLLRWRGEKPSSGLQEAARAARYQLLAQAARAAGASHILTAHTLDDQAETVLIRMMRGSGLSGLAAIRRLRRHEEFVLMRPLLNVPKARLIATLDAAGIAYARDASNLDPRFTRARLRRLMPTLAGEGLDARRLALLARRVQRAETMIEWAVDQAARVLPAEGEPIRIDAAEFRQLPEEAALRLLGRAIARAGDEGPVELGKLEALCAALRSEPSQPLRRTLAGSLVTLARGRLVIERAPPRRTRPVRSERSVPGLKAPAP